MLPRDVQPQGSVKGQGQPGVRSAAGGTCPLSLWLREEAEGTAELGWGKVPRPRLRGGAQVIRGLQVGTQPQAPHLGSVWEQDVSGTGQTPSPIHPPSPCPQSSSPTRGLLPHTASPTTGPPPALGPQPYAQGWVARPGPLEGLEVSPPIRKGPELPTGHKALYGRSLGCPKGV